MTPREYEELVAIHFRDQGYFVELTPDYNDYGVDVFASQNGEKLAIQVKMYGGTARKVNREMVMQLHGAKDYFDCTAAVIVTNGDVIDNAREVATKLRIKIKSIAANINSMSAKFDNNPLPLPKSSGELTFEKIWDQYILPLTGKTITAEDGRTNTILLADWSGVKRITSSGKTQFIQIEIFRQAIRRIAERGEIKRSEINEEYAKRASSGVVLILAQVPLFEHLSNPSRLIRRKNS